MSYGRHRPLRCAAAALAGDTHRPYSSAALRLAGVMNNVVGLAGMTGSGLRYLAYNSVGAPASKALACAGLVMLAIPTGLSVLAWGVLVAHSDLLGATGLSPWLAMAMLGAVGLYAPAFL